MLAAVALCEAVEQLVQVDPAIKWPNDLLVRGRKLAGILGESYTGPPSSYVLVGCGLNVNQAPAELSALDRPATSLRVEAGRAVHRGELLVLCLERLEAWLARPFGEREQQLRYAWEYRLWGRGLETRFQEQGEQFEGQIEGVALDGALLVRLADGGLRRLTTGEILLQPTSWP
jgi:BirA family biotin operon repressor/biotin-[acetyl-CoA-carboxylase] ligase